jgi:acyl phosphate:glycerol-3-phosphate acyltransferase
VLGPGLAVVAYLLGSISFGLIAAARAGVDLRAGGSGNVGATNVGRVLGKRTGRIVLVLDALKGALPVAVGHYALHVDERWVAAAGALAVLGHCLPIWHGFRGGKGAATAAGVLLPVLPVAGALGVLGYVALKKATRRASVGSLAGAVVGAITASLTATGPFVWMAWVVAGLIVLRHVDNIGRLVQGTEPES